MADPIPLPTVATDPLAAAIERIDRRLTGIEERLGKLDAAVAMAPSQLAMIGDIVDGWAARMQAAGVDIDERGKLLLHAGERLTSPEALKLLDTILQRVHRVQTLLESGVLEESAVTMVGRAGQALTDTCCAPVEPKGPVGALLALNDPEVRKALGFAIQFAQRFGATLDKPLSLPERA